MEWAMWNHVDHMVGVIHHLTNPKVNKPIPTLSSQQVSWELVHQKGKKVREKEGKKKTKEEEEEGKKEGKKIEK